MNEGKQFVEAQTIVCKKGHDAKMDKQYMSKGLFMLRNHPLAVYGVFRMWLLFKFTHYLWRIMGSSGADIGKNVRIQRLSCLCTRGKGAGIHVGDNTIIYEEARLQAFEEGNINIGSDSIIGPTRITSRYQIEIGKRFLSSWNVFIQDFDPHPVNRVHRARQVLFMTANFQPCFCAVPKVPDLDREEWCYPGAPVVIGDDVWVGANSTILKGAKIGSGSIVATGSVVLKGEYPENSLIAGNPAKVIKQLLE